MLIGFSRLYRTMECFASNHRCILADAFGYLPGRSEVMSMNDQRRRRSLVISGWHVGYIVPHSGIVLVVMCVVGIWERLAGECGVCLNFGARIGHG
ncbi:hypothetical protein BDN72DRAFT_283393 [Pluteus cervinus]|uniref:Uncharacterized protein n=1 Tax=Pluteus cervinus TaxID=181527 RepID=A0ACD3B765_9AGAR|nr:hypothetical protein BDN72DRAFT_283393 [Pluteus cervinus]